MSSVHEENEQRVEGDDEESYDESDIDPVDPWNKNKPPRRKRLLFVAFFWLFWTVVAVALSISAYSEDDTSPRYDEYSPNRIALLNRHFSALQPFRKSHFDLYDPSDCVRQITVNYELSQLDPPQKPIYPNPDCIYSVPYPSVFAAMAASALGLVVVSLYAWDVMAQPRGTDEMSDASETIHKAALQFLHMEYACLLPFVVALWAFLFFAIDARENDWVPATSCSFLMGAFLSASCGYMGMFIATEGNCRTAAACYSDHDRGLKKGLAIAFRTGACMGLGVVSCGLGGLALSYASFSNANAMGGFGFGASAVALFARVGGGIYTKAADVGADLCGKVDLDLAEDSPRNPATIADCVGDNVGDVAGMGADLFESYVGALVAACVLGAGEFGEKGVAYPFWISMIGLSVSMIFTIKVKVMKEQGQPAELKDLLKALRFNVFGAAGFLTVLLLFLSMGLFNSEDTELDRLDNAVANRTEERQLLEGELARQLNPGMRMFGCVSLGLLCGVLIGIVTEYFTSHTSSPTRSIARASEFGPGPVIIQGLGMGMYSTAAPLLFIAGTALSAYYLAGFYGTAIACVGMLSTLGVTMATDAYGPVSDNAGGIAEMTQLPPWVRETTDKLDALGNTTAATGKGFANGSAVLSALSLLVAFARVAGVEEVNLLQPVVVCGVLLGALLPYVFAAMTMLSVNKTAQEMMWEVRRQFVENPDLLTNTDVVPEYDRCIEISAKSSLKEMLMPGVLAIFSPMIVGFLFGSHSLVGLLMGAISSGYLLGVEMSNSGGAWDNAKKWVEAGELVVDGELAEKGGDCHKAAVCGDTVGDPFKDTSGPALNILIKLMTRFSFVLAPLFEPDWTLWYIGVFLLVGASVLIAVIYMVFLKEVDEDEWEEEWAEKENQALVEQEQRSVEESNAPDLESTHQVEGAVGEPKFSMTDGNMVPMISP
eukprot:TRINITY_DN177_c0_g2_i2.p1 TRINITY_DN177_c0_g2~~TRINITY_DN177_c0_g2_i2.p1  ORF type:complete len:940 (+),score=300.30 TRINITY_DN177_c0_g2_i2:972-3791(+)